MILPHLLSTVLSALEAGSGQKVTKPGKQDQGQRVQKIIETTKQTDASP